MHHITHSSVFCILFVHLGELFEQMLIAQHPNSCVYFYQYLGVPEDKPFDRSLMEEVDLDSYQTALEEVLTWLLSAEDSLQAQGDISNDVEEVKEQFHTHEVCLSNIA